MAGDADERAGYAGDRDEVPGYDDPDLGWLPTTPAQQSCAICGSGTVTWLHPLAPDRVGYRVYGKGHTLSSFWTLCEGCESRYAAGDDAALLGLMMTSDGWLWERPMDVAELLEQPLSVFHAADLGGRRFRGSMPATG